MNPKKVLIGDHNHISLGLKILFWSLILWMVVPFSIGYVESGLNINLPMGGYGRVRLQQLILCAFPVAALLGLWLSRGSAGVISGSQVGRVGSLVASLAFVSLEFFGIIFPDLAGHKMMTLNPVLFDLSVFLAGMHFSDLSRDVDSPNCSASWGRFYRSYFVVAISLCAMSVMMETGFDSIPGDYRGVLQTVGLVARFSLWAWGLKLLRDMRIMLVVDGM
jgi:hypothetical protein